MQAHQFTIVVALVIWACATNLSPQRLQNWQSKWAANAIELSQANAKAEDVTVTFLANPLTTIKSAWVQISFPDGFDISAARWELSIHPLWFIGISGQSLLLSGIELNRGVDTKLAVAGVNNPTVSGGYGPFGILSRCFQFGQIMDINKVFGSVGVAPQANLIDNLNVDLIDPSNKWVGATGNTLSFKFNIQKDLWKHDGFKLFIDDQWRVETGITCSSSSYDGRLNHFNGTRENDPHFLDCSATEKATDNSEQTVYVYGLANDIDISLGEDYTFVDLRLTSVSNPNAVYLAANYQWKVQTVRFATQVVLEQWSSADGPMVNSAQITTGTYTTAWGMPQDQIVNGMTVFMHVSVTTVNPIPFGGEILLTLTEVLTSTWNGTANCFVLENLTGTQNQVTNTATWETSDRGILVHSLPQLPGGKEVTIRVLATFQSSSASSISSAITFNRNGGEKIDESSEALASFTTNSNDSKLTQSAIYLTDAAGNQSNHNQAGGGESSLFFKLLWQANSNTDENTESKVYCPITITGQNDFLFYMNTSDGFNSRYRLQSADLSNGHLEMDANNTNLSAPIITANSNNPDYPSITYNLNANTTPTSSQSLTVGIYRNQAPFLRWPNVSTNIATKYECWFEISNREASVHSSMRDTVQIEVAAREWKEQPMTMPVVCKDTVNGQVLEFKFAPNIINIPADEIEVKYYISLELLTSISSAQNKVQDRLGSNLNHDDPYPAIWEGALNSTGTTFTLQADDMYQGVRVANFGGYRVDQDEALCYFPVSQAEINASGTFSARVTAWWQSIDDNRYKNIYYTQTALVGEHLKLESISNNFATAEIGIGAGTVNGQVADELGFQLKATNDLKAESWLQFVLPRGYKFNDQSLIYSSTNGAKKDLDTILRFSSPIRDFQFPTILGKTVQEETRIKTSTENQILINLVAFDLGVQDSNQVYIQSGNPSAVWTNRASLSLTSSRGSITLQSISPSQLNKRGPMGVDINMTIEFKVENTIPQSGNIALTFNSKWGVTGMSFWQIVGIQGTWTLNSNIATVNGFGEQGIQKANETLLGIRIKRLLSPSLDDEENNGALQFRFIDSLQTTDGTNLIDRYLDTSVNQVTIVESEQSGSSNFFNITAYPQIINSSHNDLWLNFTLSHSIPVGGQILINSPLTWTLLAGTNIDFCWMSLKYQSCELADDSLEIYLGEGYQGHSEIQILLDQAVDMPDSTLGGFLVTSKWASQKIDDDSATEEIQPDKLITPLPFLNGTISGATTNSIMADPTNAGESSTYTFTFKSSMVIEKEDNIQIYFPASYDPFIGEATHKFDSFPEEYYLDCKSERLGLVWCTVDHWILHIKGDTEVPVNEDVTVTIFAINNPATDISLDFGIAHVSDSVGYKAYTQAFGQVSLTPPPSILEIRSVIRSSTDLFELSNDYTFQFYIEDTIAVQDQFKVKFPGQFDLWHQDGNISYPCSTSYIIEPQLSEEKQSSDITEKWNEAVAWAVLENEVSLPPPQIEKEFDRDSLITWSINNVSNPQWGKTRQPEDSRDFDATDSDVWSSYEVWTDKFNIFLYDNSESTMAYRYKSYSNLNSSYLGFNHAYRQLSINSFDAETKTQRIVVWAGTQSKDIPITTTSPILHPLAAKKVVLTPKTNPRTPDAGKIHYTSIIHNFQFFQEQLEISFRVSADIDLSKGLYYIDWALQQTPQAGAPSITYHTPVKTLVEVVPETPNQFKISVDQLALAIPRGTRSPPIRVHMQHAPANELVISLSASAGSAVGIQVEPSTLTFTRDVTEMYFVVDIDQNFDLTSTTTQSITFLLSGQDAPVFEIDSQYSFTIEDRDVSSLSPGKIRNWNTSIWGRTTCSFAPSVDQIGTLYWQLQAKGGEILSFSELKSQTDQEIYNNQRSQLSDLLEQAHNNTQVEPLEHESWKDFQTRLYKEHLLTRWLGSLSFTTLRSNVQVQLTQLWASTNYQLWGYLENVYGNASLVSCGHLSSARQDTPQPFLMTFSGQIFEKDQEKIRESVSLWQGLNPQRNRYDGLLSSNTRRLQDEIVLQNELRYTMYPDRRRSDTGSEHLAVVAGDQLEGLRADLALILPNALLSIENEAKPLRQYPDWQKKPHVKSVGSNTATMSFLSNTVGQSCWIAVTGHLGRLPTTEQVGLGLAPNNIPVDSNWVESEPDLDENMLTIEGLSESEEYTIYCVATDYFPLWPTRSIYTDGAPIEGHIIRTREQPTDDDDWAFCILLVFALNLF